MSVRLSWLAGLVLAAEDIKNPARSHIQGLEGVCSYGGLYRATFPPPLNDAVSPLPRPDESSEMSRRRRVFPDGKLAFIPNGDRRGDGNGAAILVKDGPTNLEGSVPRWLSG